MGFRQTLVNLCINQTLTKRLPLHNELKPLHNFWLSRSLAHNTVQPDVCSQWGLFGSCHSRGKHLDAQSMTKEFIGPDLVTVCLFQL